MRLRNKNSNNCHTVEPLLYLSEEELTSREMTLLEDHIRQCATCRKSREEWLLIQNRITQEMTRSELSRSLFLIPDLTLKQADSRHRILTLVRTISGVAAMLLIILFTMEQVQSGRKISRLAGKTGWHTPNQFRSNAPRIKLNKTELPWPFNNREIIAKIHLK